MTINVTLDMTREQIVERLNSQRKLAVKRDAEVAKAHKVEEQEYLKAFRESLKQAAKWTYEEAKHQEWSPLTLSTKYRESWRRGQPECPVAMVPKFDQFLRQFELINQQTFTIHAGNTKWGQLHRLLTWSPDPIVEGDVC